MDMQAVYAKFDGDYQGAVSRLVSEERIEKYYKVFLQDTVMDDLNAAMEAQDYEAAFMAAHTMKGNSQTLGFSKLGEASSILTEALRANDYSDLDSQVAAVRVEYQRVIDAGE